MISFDERYVNKRGSVVYRIVEMNYSQVVRSVDTKYQPFLTQYVLAWYRFVKEYQRDTDPIKNFNTFDVYSLRDKAIYPTMEHSISFSSAALEQDYEGLRAVERAMLRIDDSMLDKLKAHYKRNEYAPFPPPTSISEADPLILPGRIYLKYNNTWLYTALEEKRVILVRGLMLSWENYERTTRYQVYLPDGRCLYQTDWMRNGLLPRFKDPIKRHAGAISKTQELAALTDWGMVERGELSNKQQRALGKAVLAKCKEGWV